MAGRKKAETPRRASRPAPDTAFFTSPDTRLAIYQEDFTRTGSLPDGSVDLIVTSPPYNVDIEYASVRDGITYGDYLIFSRKWLTRAYELAKPDGRLCLNIPLDKNKGGQQSVYADLTGIAKEIGWHYHATIIWNEGTISRRTAWGSFASASAPYVIAPVETIVILYRDHWKKDTRGISDISKEEFIEWTNGLWTFNGEKKSRMGHPAPFPVELPRRCIRLFSYTSDIVLDPFLGSGTTLVACRDTGRRGIGFEIDPGYCGIAKSRILEGTDLAI
ncbi:MAG: site-specific DNA-methyltransferase [Methanoregulaceae archaeon]